MMVNYSIFFVVVWSGIAVSNIFHPVVTAYTVVVRPSLRMRTQLYPWSTSSQQRQTTVSQPPNGALWMVSIGLGPEDSKTDEEETKLMEGIDYDVPDHESHRLDRRSALDERCDAWFAQLLPNGETTTTTKGFFENTSIANSIYQQLQTPVALVNDIEIKDTNDIEWTPYVTEKLPWSILYPSYGLEQFGLPIPRRNAEAWRQFDVSGMVSVEIDGNLDATDSMQSVNIDTLRDRLIVAGAWLQDDECRGRLVYFNGNFVSEISLETAATRNCNSLDDLSATEESLKQFASRLTDGWTDELVCPVPLQRGESLTSYSTLSKPNHNVGKASTQFAINSQQGTACFAALNTLQCRNMALVHETEVADKDGEVAETKPILIVYAMTPDGGLPLRAMESESTTELPMGIAHHPRTMIVAEPGTCSSIVQQTVTLNLGDKMSETPARPLLYNGYTQVLINEGANVTHTLLEESGGMPVPGVEQQDDMARAVEANRPALQNTHFEALDVHCAGREAHYDNAILSIGGNGRTRISSSVSLLQPSASCNLAGFCLANGNCRSDIKTNIHHIADGCESRQLQKSMVAGRATASFRGRIRVEQSAQQTDSQQLSRTVLLTDKARAWAVPSLEIIADDVQCTHGATVSDLREEELFYLRSRGLSVSAARSLLMFAFCNDVLTEVPSSVLGNLQTLDNPDNIVDGTKTTKRDGLLLRIQRRLQNAVPRGDRAIKGEFQSI